MPIFLLSRRDAKFRTPKCSSRFSRVLPCCHDHKFVNCENDKNRISHSFILEEKKHYFPLSSILTVTQSSTSSKVQSLPDSGEAALVLPSNLSIAPSNFVPQ